MHTYVPNEKLLLIVKEIRRHLYAGDSINVARTKACRGLSWKDIRDVYHQDQYISMLNFYMKKIGKNTQYVLKVDENNRKRLCIQR